MAFRTFVMRAFFAMGTSLFVAASSGQEYGHYEGTVQTEWLPDGRKMRLLAPLLFYDPKGKRWDAPKDWVIDGASIPQPAWSFSGGPFEGKYRNASVIHDVGCDRKVEPWEAVHEVFYYGMLASGVEPWRAKIMYGAVYHFGPRWPQVIEVPGMNIKPTDEIAAPSDVGVLAAPGSTAKVIRTYPQFTWENNGMFGTPSPKIEDVAVIEIQPPPLSLNEADFERLKAQIEASSATGGVSLQEIRSFQGGGRR